MTRHVQDELVLVIDGLRKEREDTTYQARLQLPKTAKLREIWQQVTALGYESPLHLSNSDKTQSWSEYHETLCLHPHVEVQVVADKSLADETHIHIDEPLIVCANRQDEPTVRIEKGKEWDFATKSDISQSDVLEIDDTLGIYFHRTVRMPDDGRLHQLPGSLGFFPLYNVNEYADRLPVNIVEKGGVFLPMWSREAMWMQFRSRRHSPCAAIRVYVGRINAVTGKKMDDESGIEKEVDEREQDYVVVPGQHWLDGICVEEGVVRQFVAMPLGSGYTVEGQKTGEEKHGGLQIEIIPAYKTRLRKWSPHPLPKAPSSTRRSDDTFFDELQTPVDLNLKPGDIVYSYPRDPTYWRPMEVGEMGGGPVDGEIHLQARYPDSDSSFRHRERQRSPGPTPASPVYAPTSPEFTPATPTSPAASPRSPSFYPASPGATRASPLGNKEPEEPKIKLSTKDLKAMGLAAGGKLIQDIYKDQSPAIIWNTAAARIVNVHLLDPISCEAVTHIVPPPPPIDAKSYADANLPFYVVEEQVDNRVEGGDFDNVKSVSEMDEQKGVATEPTLDPTKPTMCKECQIRLCDCITRPCNHQFCNVCIKKLESIHESSRCRRTAWQCPTCRSGVSHVAGFSAPMNLPGEEALNVKVPVRVLKVEDGRMQFQSIQTMRV